MGLKSKNRPKRGRPLAGLGLSPSQLRELMVVAQTVPVALRQAFFARVGEQLRGHELGLLHRVAHAVARELAWNATARRA
jgi:uncharacterized protein (DUF2336 family)